MRIIHAVIVIAHIAWTTSKEIESHPIGIRAIVEAINKKIEIANRPKFQEMLKARPPTLLKLSSNSTNTNPETNNNMSRSKCEARYGLVDPLEVMCRTFEKKGKSYVDWVIPALLYEPSTCFYCCHFDGCPHIEDCSEIDAGVCLDI